MEIQPYGNYCSLGTNLLDKNLIICSYRIVEATFTVLGNNNNKKSSVLTFIRPHNNFLLV